MDESKEPGVITEQLELLELQLRVANLMLKEKQRRSLFKPCRISKRKPCYLCRVKRHILRKRYSDG